MTKTEQETPKRKIYPCQQKSRVHLARILPEGHHFGVYCGMDKSRIIYTTEPDKVTCGNCRKQIWRTK